MKRLVLVLVVVAAGVAAAAFAVPRNAATVNGTGITQSALNSDLSAIAGSPSYQCYLLAQEAVRTNGQGTLPAVQGAGAGTYSTAFTDYWLGQMVNAQVIEQAVAARHSTVTAADVSAARSDLTASISSTIGEVSGTQLQCPVTASQVLASLPSSFVNEQVQLQAASEALLAPTSAGVTETDLRRYFEAHQSHFDTLCVSGIIASSTATASQLRAEVESGTPFAQVARTSSTDTASAAKGGALGCFTPAEPTYASLETDVGSLGVGQVTQPLAGGNGEYVLLEVTKRTPGSFSAVQSVVRKALLQSGEQHAGAVITAALRRSTVWVDPRYGTWTRRSATLGVVPPTSPPADTLLSPTVNRVPLSTGAGATGVGSSGTGSTGTGSTGTGSSGTGSTGTGQSG